MNNMLQQKEKREDKIYSQPATTNQQNPINKATPFEEEILNKFEKQKI